MSTQASKAIFTRYVKSLDPSSTEPPGYPSEELLERLGRILGAQMRRRGLWRAPPRFLGPRYDIYASWGDPGAFSDLRWDCFLEVIFSRRYLRRLKARADAPGGDIEGMIPKNVSRFLTEQQKLQDPYGYTVFQNLKGAVRLALYGGAIEALDDDGEIGAETLLALPGTGVGIEPASLTEEHARLWCGDLIPHLCAIRIAVQRELAKRLTRLLESGPPVFRFQSLVAPMKSFVRPHCQAADELALAEAWSGSVVPADFDELARLEPAVVRAITALDKPARTRRRLTTIWMSCVELARESEGNKMPSHNEIRSSLPVAVAKSTFNDDWVVIRNIVRRIRGTP